MPDILESIWGRRLGMTNTDFLSGCDDAQAGGNFKGIQVGSAGRGFFFASPLAVVGGVNSQFDDFLGAVIRADLWSLNKGSDGAAVNFAILAAAANGVVRGTTGANASADMAGNGIQIVGGRNYLVSGGGLTMEARVQPAAITTGNIFIGLTDTTVGTLQAPFTISAGVVTANATNGVGFVFDTAATASTTKLVSVNAGGTAQIVDTGLVPDTAAFHRYRVTVTSGGNALFYIDGAAVGALIAGTSNNIALAVATTAILAPKVEYFRRAATATNFDIDYLFAEQRLTVSR